MSAPLTVLKLGGALLTDKSTPFTLRPGILPQIAGELQRCLEQGRIERLLLVHGVGSFGHPPVMAHRLHRGFQTEGQLIHLSDTQNRVMRLRLALAEACHDAGLPVATILPSSCITADGFEADTFFFAPIAGFLKLGMIPLLGGDVLVDRQAGFSVYSGDAMAVRLAQRFDAERLIFATSVDGIYDKDPIRTPDAQRLAEIHLSALAALRTSSTAGQTADASGAMAGKLRAIARAHAEIEDGLQVNIISMVEEGKLAALLSGAAVGTQIKP